MVGKMAQIMVRIATILLNMENWVLTIDQVNREWNSLHQGVQWRWALKYLICVAYDKALSVVCWLYVAKVVQHCILVNRLFSIGLLCPYDEAAYFRLMKWAICLLKLREWNIQMYDYVVFWLVALQLYSENTYCLHINSTSLFIVLSPCRLVLIKVISSFRSGNQEEPAATQPQYHLQSRSLILLRELDNCNCQLHGDLIHMCFLHLIQRV